MVLDNFVADGQPKTSTQTHTFRGETRIENLWKIFRRNADAGIADRNLDSLTRSPCFDDDFAAMLNRLGRVHKDIHKYLVEFVRVTFDLRNIAETLHDTNPVLHLIPQKTECAFDTLVNVDFLPLRFIQPCKVFQASNDLHDALSRDFIVSANLAEDVEKPPDFVIGRRFQQLANLSNGSRHNVVVTVNRSHGRIDLVRDTGHKQSQGSHFFRLDQLRH